jgi:hypothetical protein
MFGAGDRARIAKIGQQLPQWLPFSEPRFISPLICFLQLFDFDFVRIVGIFESLANFLGIVGAASLRREWRVLPLAILIDELFLALFRVLNSRVINPYPLLSIAAQVAGVRFVGATG